VAVELHLPDLPEVPLSLGPARGAPARPPVPWPVRLRETLASLLPLLVMLLLVLASWWLVKNSPRPAADPGPQVQRTEPDYTMSGFTLERFGPDGRLTLRLEGEQMRHYPHTDRIEIDGVRVRALSPDGRETLARAARAIAAGDGSQAQLLGGAEVVRTDAAGGELVMRGEFLHAFFITEQVRSHLPVRVTHGSTVLEAGGLEYDHAQQRLELKGPLRAVFAPQRAGTARPR
jgi:lipopolysaccharide export system protein LptC